jgi:hypothetical protein
VALGSSVTDKRFGYLLAQLDKCRKNCNTKKCKGICMNDFGQKAGFEIRRPEQDPSVQAVKELRLF